MAKIKYTDKTPHTTWLVFLILDRESFGPLWHIDWHSWLSYILILPILTQLLRGIILLNLLFRDFLTQHAERAKDKDAASWVHSQSIQKFQFQFPKFPNWVELTRAIQASCRDLNSVIHFPQKKRQIWCIYPQIYSSVVQWFPRFLPIEKS